MQTPNRTRLFATLGFVLATGGTTLPGCGAGAHSTPPTATRSAADTVKAPILMVYGPGGPLGPMKELAERFSRKRDMQVHVVAGPEAKWIAQAATDADVIFGGAEYMLTKFTHDHPELVDERTRTELYPRAAGILVRKGNPKNITSLEDLARDGVHILDVNGAGQLGLWEDLAGRKGLIPGIQDNIAVSVSNSADGIEQWKTNRQLDAWITYESWHYRLRDLTDLVQLQEGDRVYRGTPIAISKISDNQEAARQFIAYLKSDDGHAVFRKWGWK